MISGFLRKKDDRILDVVNKDWYILMNIVHKRCANTTISCMQSIYRC